MFSPKSKNEKGQGLIEYAIILVLIAIVVIAAATTLGKHVSWQYGDIVCMQDQGWAPSGGCSLLTTP